MADRFQFPYYTSRFPGTLSNAPIELWGLIEPRNPRAAMDFTIARLRPGVAIPAARDELNAIARRLAAQYPETNAGFGVELTPLADTIVGSVRPKLVVLLGAVGLVLLVACANVANLLLVRASTRTREIAIRTAIGAARSRLIRQFLTESTILALAGSVLGLAFVRWGTPIVLAMAGTRIPRAEDIGVDWRVVLFLVVISIATGIAFGLAPALAASRADVQGALKGTAGFSGTGGVFRRIRDALAIVEVALAFVLIIGAGLLVRELLRLRNTDVGLNPRDVLTMHLTPDLSAQDCYALVPQVEALPGVRAAAFAQMLPLQSWGWTATMNVIGRPPFSPADRPLVELRYVTPRYFDALGIPIQRGRAFTEADVATSQRVIIVNEALVRRFFGDVDPIGQQTDRGTIVGVAGDVRQAGVERPALPDVFYPMAQNVSQVRDLGMTLIVSARIPPAALVAPIRQSISRTHPTLAIFGIKTMEEVVSESLADSNLYTRLVISFAVLALVLACAGIYGVMSYVVAVRTREFGIRIALGAESAGVQRMVMKHAAALVAGGLVLGLGGAVATSRLLESLIVGAGRVQPLMVGTAAVLLGSVGLIASMMPARRAARVDPLEALRQD
jgi:putative ABC transport system permease protein